MSISKIGLVLSVLLVFLPAVFAVDLDASETDCKAAGYKWILANPESGTNGNCCGDDGENDLFYSGEASTTTSICYKGTLYSQGLDDTKEICEAFGKNWHSYNTFESYNFNSDSLGKTAESAQTNLPVGWTTGKYSYSSSKYPSSVYTEIINSAVTDGNAFQLYDYTYHNYVSAKQDFSGTLSKGTLSFRMYPSGQNSGAGVFMDLRAADDTVVIQLAITVRCEVNAQGKVYACINSKGQLIENLWHDIKITFDTSKAVYNVYVDGILFISNAVITNTKEIEYLYVYTQLTNQYRAILYLDDLEYTNNIDFCCDDSTDRYTPSGDIGVATGICYNGAYYTSGLDGSEDLCSGLGYDWLSGLITGSNGNCCGDDGESDMFKSSEKEYCYIGLKFSDEVLENSQELCEEFGYTWINGPTIGWIKLPLCDGFTYPCSNIENDYSVETLSETGPCCGNNADTKLDTFYGENGVCTAGVYQNKNIDSDSAVCEEFGNIYMENVVSGTNGNCCGDDFESDNFENADYMCNEGWYYLTSDSDSKESLCISEGYKWLSGIVTGTNGPCCGDDLLGDKFFTEEGTCVYKFYDYIPSTNADMCLILGYSWRTISEGVGYCCGDNGLDDTVYYKDKACYKGQLVTSETINSNKEICEALNLKWIGTSCCGEGINDNTFSTNEVCSEGVYYAQDIDSSQELCTKFGYSWIASTSISSVGDTGETFEDYEVGSNIGSLEKWTSSNTGSATAKIVLDGTKKVLDLYDPDTSSGIVSNLAFDSPVSGKQEVTINAKMTINQRTTFIFKNQNNEGVFRLNLWGDQYAPGEWVFSGTSTIFGIYFDVNQYHEYKIVFDTDADRVDFYIDGQAPTEYYGRATTGLTFTNTESITSIDITTYVNKGCSACHTYIDYIHLGWAKPETIVTGTCCGDDGLSDNFYKGTIGADASFCYNGQIKTDVDQTKKEFCESNSNFKWIDGITTGIGNPCCGDDGALDTFFSNGKFCKNGVYSETTCSEANVCSETTLGGSTYYCDSKYWQAKAVNNPCTVNDAVGYCDTNKTCYIEDAKESCDNGLDDDGNGLIDCKDSGCLFYSGCAPKQEDCNNDVDDDGDGSADCSDNDCKYYSACTSAQEICNNGIDDNANGLIDCYDPNCQVNSTCTSCVSSVSNCLNMQNCVYAGGNWCGGICQTISCSSTSTKDVCELNSNVWLSTIEKCCGDNSDATFVFSNGICLNGDYILCGINEGICPTSYSATCLTQDADCILSCLKFSPESEVGVIAGEHSEINIGIQNNCNLTISSARVDIPKYSITRNIESIAIGQTVTIPVQSEFPEGTTQILVVLKTSGLEKQVNILVNGMSEETLQNITMRRYTSAKKYVETFKAKMAIAGITRYNERIVQVEDKLELARRSMEIRLYGNAQIYVEQALEILKINSGEVSIYQIQSVGWGIITVAFLVGTIAAMVLLVIALNQQKRKEEIEEYTKDLEKYGTALKKYKGIPEHLKGRYSKAIGEMYEYLKSKREGLQKKK